MQKQGKILRDCSNGNGLISSQGEKWEFNLETHWKSDAPPQLGSDVYIELDESGKVVAVQSVASVKQAELARKRQGTILRDGQNGEGIISSQGQKWAFNLAIHWKSDSVPQVGKSVNFVVDDNNQLVSIEAIDSRAEAEQKLKELGEKFKTDGLPIAQNFWQNLRAYVGIPRLVLLVLLLISWYTLDVIVAGKRFSADFFEILAFSFRHTVTRRLERP